MYKRQLYRFLRTQGVGTNAVLDAVHQGRELPILLIPAIFLATLLTHLAGGSAGREGAALQIGGDLGEHFGKMLRMDDKDCRLATLCGMSALFSALFGTPLAAVFFALEVVSIGVLYYSRPQHGGKRPQCQFLDCGFPQARAP